MKHERVNKPHSKWPLETVIAFGLAFLMQLIVLSSVALLLFRQAFQYKTVPVEQERNRFACTPALPKPVFGPALKRSLHNDTVYDCFQNITNLSEYIDAEKAYKFAVLEHTQPLQNELVAEMEGLCEDNFDLFLMWKYGYLSSDGFQSLQRWPCLEGCRSVAAEYRNLKDGLVELETIFQIDNVLGVPKGSKNFKIGVLEVSPTEDLLAFSVDTRGDEHYRLYFYNITSKSLLDFRIMDTYYTGRWIDNSIFIFCKLDRLDIPRFVHSVDVETGRVRLIYRENAEVMTVSVSSNGPHVFINSIGMKETEVRMIIGHYSYQLLLPRRNNVIYHAAALEDFLIIRTNWNAHNFQILKVFPDFGSYENATVLVPESCDFIEYHEVFSEYMLLWVWRNGLKHIVIYFFESTESIALGWNRDLYAVFPSTVADMESRIYRYRWDSGSFLYSNQSLIEKKSVYEYNTVKRESIEISRLVDTCKYAPTSDYRQFRVLIPTYDNLQMPISLVHRRNVEYEKSNSSIVVFAYGAYGGMYETVYHPLIVSLVKRGIIVAIAHPRGDADMGHYWHEQGRLSNKINTFLDMRTCLKFLKSLSSGRLALISRSAGGLIAGVAARFFGNVKLKDRAWKLRGKYENDLMEREILKAFAGGGNSFVDVVVAQVPFFDPINDMVDPEIPWVAYEWYLIQVHANESYLGRAEWGNPLRKDDYFRMKDYSPFENLARQDYPAMYITAGVADTRVDYREPLKYVAGMRALKTNELCENSTRKGTPLILDLQQCGHHGTIGNVQKEDAEWMAFVIDQFEMIKRTC